MPISAAGFKQREPGRPSYALVASVAVPMAIGSLTQVLTGLLDTAIVGRIGPDELAALALVTPVYQVVVGALVSIRTALHIVLGRRFGANDPEGFARSFATGLIVWTMLAMTVGGLLAAAAPWLISTLFPTTSPSAEGSIHYLQARAVGILPLVLTMGYLSGFVLLGFRWVPMVYPLVLAVLHLPVGWVLAHPVGWGLTGVGVAGIISGSLGLAFMLVLQRWVHVRGFTLRIPARPFSAADARTIVVLGVPEGLMVGLSFLANVILVKVVSPLGNVALGATQIINNLDFALSLLAFGYMQSVTLFVSQALGGDRLDEARVAARRCYAQCLLVGSVPILILLVWPSVVLQLFTSDGAVVAAAEGPARIVAAAYPIMAAAYVFGGAVKGYGDTVSIFWVNFLTSYLVRIPAAVVFGLWLGGGLLGVFFGNVLYAIARASGTWPRMKIHEANAARRYAPASAGEPVSTVH